MEAGLVQEAGLRQKVEKMYEITPEGVRKLEEKAEGEHREQALAK
jgi:DNA-binding PadR family transcriptional regulator